jgi:carbamoyl-phosphate synthase large subunit
VNIFITGVGGDLAQNVISCLRKIEGVSKIVGSDINSQNSGILFVDEFALVSKPNNENYISLLREFFNKFDIDVFIPMNQNEIEFFSNLDEFILNDLFKDIKFVGLNRFCVQTFLDKLKTAQWLEESGFTSPKVYEISEISELDLPVIVKPRTGSGSKGVIKCLNLQEVRGAIVLTKNPIIQQYIDAEDSEFTIGIYSNGFETKVISFRRKIAGSGATSWAKHEIHDSIISLGLSIAEKLTLFGSINVQLRIKESKLYIFEINPRFSSTVLMREELGFKDVAWSLGDFSTFNSFDSIKETGAEFATYVRSVRLE